MDIDYLLCWWCDVILLQVVVVFFVYLVGVLGWCQLCVDGYFGQFVLFQCCVDVLCDYVYGWVVGVGWCDDYGVVCCFGICIGDFDCVYDVQVYY